MTNVNPSRLGNTHRQENFPVASLLVRARHRPIILAFYYFVRAADDVADDPALTSSEKIERLDRMEAALLGEAGLDLAAVLLDLTQPPAERLVGLREAMIGLRDHGFGLRERVHPGAPRGIGRGTTHRLRLGFRVRACRRRLGNRAGAGQE